MEYSTYKYNDQLNLNLKSISPHYPLFIADYQGYHYPGSYRFGFSRVTKDKF